MADLKLQFIKPGMYTLVQDGGRHGFQKYGIPIGGALDQTSMHIANWLVGNSLNNPVLEITVIGPQIQVEGECQIAITGADISLNINGQPAPMNETLDVSDGAIISFGKLKKGCRAYLSVRGKWHVENWLNSSSAAVFNGKEIIQAGLVKKGQIIEISVNDFITKKKPPEIINELIEEKDIRVLPGPEFELFPRIIIGQFFSRTFHLSNESNRMGYRLEERIEDFTSPQELISSGTLPGTIQITNAGQPIILLSDAQTVGGYYRIANVIAADMDRLAQMKPGDEIKFELVDLETACEVLGKRNRILNSLL